MLKFHPETDCGRRNSSEQGRSGFELPSLRIAVKRSQMVSIAPLMNRILGHREEIVRLRDDRSPI